MVPMFLAVMDQTIVAAALPAIAAELGDPERVSWIVVSYLMAATIAAPVYGRLGDSYGRRRLMFVALAMFIVASLLCAVSISTEMLVAGRVLQGLGGGGLMTLSQALIGETIPPRERGRFQGYLAGIVVSASTFGPVAGGFLTQYYGWRSIFLVSAPLGLLALFLTLRLPARAGSGHPGRFDAGGLVLLIAFIAPLLVALEQMQKADPSALPRALALTVLSVISLLCLIWREKRAAVPLLPIALLRQPSVWRADALAACHGAALVSLTTFIPIYLRVVRGASPSESGLLLLPLTVGVGLGSILTGRLVSRTGYTAIFPSLGLLGATMTMVLVAYGAPYLTVTQLALALSACALFMGTTMGVVQVTVQSEAGHDMLGAAAASVQLSRSIGAGLGAAIVGAVLFMALRSQGAAVTDLFGHLLQEGPSALDMLPAAERGAVLLSVADGFRAAFLTIAAFAGLGMVFAWTIPLRRI